MEDEEMEEEEEEKNGNDKKGKRGKRRFFSTTTTTTKLKNRMAPMTKIAPIIMNFFRASYICGSKYILTQEHDQETFSSFVHPY